MIRACDRASTFILPQNRDRDPSIAVLIGRPVALVRASLKIDLKGLPAYHQSWSVFNEVIKKYDPDHPIKRDTEDFEKVQFPIKLGKIDSIEDGLFGYFLSNEDGTNYRKFYTSAVEYTDNAENDEPEVLAPEPTTLVLDSSPDSTPIKITMLIDPLAKIHATTGIFPTKAIEIPADQYVNILRKLSVTFLCAPVLSGGERIALPLPRESNTSWHWIERDKAHWVTGDVEDSTQKITLFTTPLELREGWLKMLPENPTET